MVFPFSAAYSFSLILYYPRSTPLLPAEAEINFCWKMQASNLLTKARVALPIIARRNIGISAPVLQKASDPIQQLFLDKVREYKQKSSGGKMVDPTPEIQKEKLAELDRVARQFGGGGGTDMTKFPDFKFPDVKLTA